MGKVDLALCYVFFMLVGYLVSAGGALSFNLMDWPVWIRFIFLGYAAAASIRGLYVYLDWDVNGRN